MVSKEMYFKILEYIYRGMFLVNNDEIFRSNEFNKIGDYAVAMILNKFGIIYEDLKAIICMRLNYKDLLSYDDFCVKLCTEIFHFCTYPRDELSSLIHHFDQVKNKKDELIQSLQIKINSIDERIIVNKEQPNNCGSLLKKQMKICSRNRSNLSLLKDLTAIESEYIKVHNEIQKDFAHQEMLKYAKEQIEKYFSETILCKTNELVNHDLKALALKLASEDNQDIKSLENIFSEYNRYLDAWCNATQSIMKPFYIIKMRKFYDDIETYFDSNYNGAYWNKTDDLVNLCRSKYESIMDCDKWILLKNSDGKKYLESLNDYISMYKVVDYIKGQIASLYCIQKRKEILFSLVQQFENTNYLVFINLVIIQMEGILNDLFLDANIFKRLSGQLDMYEKDNLKVKFDRNKSMGEMEEATLYFKFYFNNIIRNIVAHGKVYYKSEELETIAFELILDLQYVIHLASTKSDTSNAANFIKIMQKSLEKHSHSERSAVSNKRLLVLLNSGYKSVDSKQLLYWIFNPYYFQAYQFYNITDQNLLLQNYLISAEFWSYVNQYVITYDDNTDIDKVIIQHSFVSRVKALKGYIAKHNIELLPVINEVEDNLGKLHFRT